MITLETAHIEELRGIRSLDIAFRGSTFVISGPNGSGKSGVIDAVEFGLTGEIGRLTGRGTRGLTVSEHGPHVDKSKLPDAAFVELKVFLPELGKSATITRRISAPKKPKIVPSDPDVKAMLAEIAEHPELTLSRREILRFILVEPTKRSEEIQALLRLDEIGQLRSALVGAHNKLQASESTAATQAKACRGALLLHLQIPTMVLADMLEVVNKRRRVLGLSEIQELTSGTKLDAGLESTGKIADFNKKSALADLKALSEKTMAFSDLGKGEARILVSDLERLENDPALLAAIQERSFLEQGLEFIDGPECPLCDTPWTDEDHLRSHLERKLARSEGARTLQESLLENGTAIAKEIIQVTGLLQAVLTVAESHGDTVFRQALAGWKDNLEAVKSNLATVDGIMSLRNRFKFGWLEVPDNFNANLRMLIDKIEAVPDQTAALDAQTFLTTAQLRLSDYREALKKNKAAEIAFASARAAYCAYCEVIESELNSLYAEVQEDFSTFYREINGHDEATFTAKFTPEEGKLDFAVDFYERGLFPPGAYHSEGHQDSMGVCLYLALMKRLFGKQFTFALLDDVVMSVDVDHRYRFCKLLKSHFPNTQFIITTHDRLWAAQMKSAGLVMTKSSLAFHGWSIDTGPIVESNREVWDEIADALGTSKVEVAALALRRHLEHVSRQLADQLGASATFRADGNYELGDLLPSAISRMKELLGRASSAAQSWGDAAASQSIAKRKERLSVAATASNAEQWAVNKAVHYNEWANFSKNDFQPVVDAFKALLETFSCDICRSWLHISPRIGAESLRCACNGITINLKTKSKSVHSATF